MMDEIEFVPINLKAGRNEVMEHLERVTQHASAILGVPKEFIEAPPMKTADAIFLGYRLSTLNSQPSTCS